MSSRTSPGARPLGRLHSPTKTAKLRSPPAGPGEIASALSPAKRAAAEMSGQRPVTFNVYIDSPPSGAAVAPAPAYGLAGMERADTDASALLPHRLDFPAGAAAAPSMVLQPGGPGSPGSDAASIGAQVSPARAPEGTPAPSSGGRTSEWSRLLGDIQTSAAKAQARKAQREGRSPPRRTSPKVPRDFSQLWPERSSRPLTSPELMPPPPPRPPAVAGPPEDRRPAPTGPLGTELKRLRSELLQESALVADERPTTAAAAQGASGRPADGAASPPWSAVPVAAHGPTPADFFRATGGSGGQRAAPAGTASVTGASDAEARPAPDAAVVPQHTYTSAPGRDKFEPPLDLGVQPESTNGAGGERAGWAGFPTPAAGLPEAPTARSGERAAASPRASTATATAAHGSALGYAPAPAPAAARDVAPGPGADAGVGFLSGAAGGGAGGGDPGLDARTASLDDRSRDLLADARALAASAAAHASLARPQPARLPRATPARTSYDVGIAHGQPRAHSLAATPAAAPVRLPASSLSLPRRTAAPGPTPARTVPRSVPYSPARTYTSRVENIRSMLGEVARRQTQPALRPALGLPRQLPAPPGGTGYTPHTPARTADASFDAEGVPRPVHSPVITPSRRELPPRSPEQKMVGDGLWRKAPGEHEVPVVLEEGYERVELVGQPVEFNVHVGAGTAAAAPRRQLSFAATPATTTTHAGGASRYGIGGVSGVRSAGGTPRSLRASIAAGSPVGAQRLTAGALRSSAGRIGELRNMLTEIRSAVRPGRRL